MYVRHMALMVPFDCLIPKHHIMYHLLVKSGFQGNPAVYATWLDEALNKSLKQACKNASSATFYESVLLKLREMLKAGRST